MNCPTCGAQNDADARFCAECGTPLENPDVEATIIGQKFDMFDDLADDDMTIMSTPARLAEEAKTLAVDPDAMAAAFQPEPAPASLTDSARVAMLPATPPEADEPDSPRASRPSPTPPPAAAEGKSGGSKKILMTVGSIILFIVILCCCCSMIIVGRLLSDPTALEDLMRQFQLGSIGLQIGSLLLA
jgi:hypothetical protein